MRLNSPSNGGSHRFVWFSFIFSLLVLAWSAATYAKGSESLELYAVGQFPVSDFDTLPIGVEPRHLHTPALLGLDFETRGSANGGFWMDLHGALLGFSRMPAFGIGLGPTISNGAMKLRLGIEAETNGTLSESAVAESYLRTGRLGLVAELRIERPILQPGVDLRWFSTFNSQLADFEGLPTDIGHSSTFMIRPVLRLQLPVLRAEAAVAFYSLGTVGITSKEFAFNIPRQTLAQPSLGVGADLSAVELWVRTMAVYPFRSGDSIEYLYMVPYYAKDNLMTRKALTAEVRLKF